MTQLATLCSMRLALEGFIAYPASVGCEALCRKHKSRLSKEGGIFAFLEDLPVFTGNTHPCGRGLVLGARLANKD